MYLACILLEQGEIEEGKATFNGSLTHKNIKAYIYWADTLFGFKQFEEAEAIYKQVIELDQKNSNVYSSLAEINSMNNNFEAMPR